MPDPQFPKSDKDISEYKTKPANIKLTEEQEKKLDYFLTAPMRSADRLMKQLYSDDHFYETGTYAWVDENAAKKLFLFYYQT